MSANTDATIHQNDASSTQKRVEALLLQSTMFLIPTNLAYHIYYQGAYINSRLSDYLLPKLYLSDLPLVALLIIFIFNNYKYLAKSFYKNRYTSLLIAYLLIISLVSIKSISSLWYVAKVIEFYLFGVYLSKTYTARHFLSLIAPPLWLSVGFQSIVGMSQYIRQNSVYGYFLFGEPDLHSLGVAKMTTARGLEIIPYGTTAHPNVLAGFIVVSLLLLSLRTHLSPKKISQKAVEIIVTGLSIPILYLTRSFTALSGFLFAISINKAKKNISSLYGRVIYQIILSITIIISLLFFPIFHQLNIFSDNPSFYERYELNTIALRLLHNHPITGIGPNMFTLYLPQFPISKQQSYVLQPVHNGLLLVLAESGLIGVVLISLNLHSWAQRTKAVRSSISAFLPLVALLFILQFDHYPLTLQTGQLLLTISLVLPALKTA